MSLAGRIIFLGAGNMAEALVRGLLASGRCAPSQVAVTDIRPERLAWFRETFGVGGFEDNVEALRAGAAVVVLAVKPQQIPQVLPPLAAVFPPDAMLLSIAAGVRTGTLERQLGGAVRVVRSMPNTPALVGEGITAISPGSRAGEPDLALAAELLGSVGVVVRVEEDELDAVTAVSGSGPAYVFSFMEALLDGATRLGLTPELARTLVFRTLSGAVRLAESTGVPPAELRERVTSKGGTTAAALAVVAERGVHAAWVDALTAAHRRSKELSNA